LEKTLSAGDEDDTIIVGGAMWVTSSSTLNLFMFKGDAGATTHVTIAYAGGAAGKPITAYRGTTSGTLLGTSSTGPPESQWVYVEAKVRLHDTAGLVVVKIDEVVVLNLSGVDTKNGGTDTTFDNIEVHGSTTDLRWDDIYLANEQGSVNNDFLGAVVVEALGPNGNGNSSQFVGSDGNSTDNYLLVDDGAVAGNVDDSGADYVESSVDNDKDTYTFENSTLGSSLQTVLGVMAYAKARRSDTGARTLALVARLSGTEADSADKTINTSSGNFGWVGHAFETKPGGGSWAISDVDSAEFGVKARP
jgi:hypothetical protein